jgi:hypothetical protein
MRNMNDIMNDAAPKLGFYGSVASLIGVVGYGVAQIPRCWAWSAIRWPTF